MHKEKLAQSYFITWELGCLHTWSILSVWTRERLLPPPLCWSLVSCQQHVRNVQLLFTDDSRRQQKARHNGKATQDVFQNDLYVNMLSPPRNGVGEFSSTLLIFISRRFFLSATAHLYRSRLCNDYTSSPVAFTPNTNLTGSHVNPRPPFSASDSITPVSCALAEFRLRKGRVFKMTDRWLIQTQWSTTLSTTVCAAMKRTCVWSRNLNQYFKNAVHIFCDISTQRKI